jgi:uncharacterized OB-fold protein
VGKIAPNVGINDTQTFWDASARGELLLKRCVDSGKVFHYPREHSPFTGGRTEWVRASGLGVIYSCSVSYRAKPNYCIAYIKLDEGPIILSNVEHSNLTEISIGQRVQVSFRIESDGRHTPVFVLVD